LWPKRDGVPGADARARAKVTTESCFAPPFGKLSLDSPQLYRCPCEEPPDRKTFSPLAELLSERTSPELAYLETKFAALVSYGLTVKLLKEVLPIHDDLSTTAILNAGTPHG
jgi:hypothetical protein